MQGCQFCTTGTLTRVGTAAAAVLRAASTCQGRRPAQPMHALLSSVSSEGCIAAVQQPDTSCVRGSGECLLSASKGVTAVFFECAACGVCRCINTSGFFCSMSHHCFYCMNALGSAPLPTQLSFSVALWDRFGSGSAPSMQRQKRPDLLCPVTVYTPLAMSPVAGASPRWSVLSDRGRMTEAARVFSVLKSDAFHPFSTDANFQY